MTRSYKLVYYIDENYDDLIGKVKEFLDNELYVKRKRRVYSFEIIKAFPDVPIFALRDAIFFLYYNGYYNLGISKKYKNELFVEKIPVSKEIVVSNE